jgi:dolichol-phosphate mannosyltransferase
VSAPGEARPAAHSAIRLEPSSLCPGAAPGPDTRVLVSVVLPAHNEEVALPQVLHRLERVLAGVEYEVIVVDDGSSDDTWNILVQYQGSSPRVRGIRFTRNFGHQSAILAGLLASRGEATITLDADGQHPPELIPTFLEHWREGALVVQAVRSGAAGETPVKRWTSRLFYRVFGKLAGVSIPEGSADFRLLGRAVVKEVLSSAGPLLFLRGLIPWMGYPVAFVPFCVEPRLAGHTSYTLRRMLRFSLDGLLAFSVVPLRLAVGAGALISALAFVYLAYVVVIWLTSGDVVPGWASTAGLLALLGGIQLLTLGVLGEYVGRLFIATLRRPHFVVREHLGHAISSVPGGEPRL